jgi:hypothetical protein
MPCLQVISTLQLDAKFVHQFQIPSLLVDESVRILDASTGLGREAVEILLRERGAREAMPLRALLELEAEVLASSVSPHGASERFLFDPWRGEEYNMRMMVKGSGTTATDQENLLLEVVRAAAKGAGSRTLHAVAVAGSERLSHDSEEIHNACLLGDEDFNTDSVEDLDAFPRTWMLGGAVEASSDSPSRRPPSVLGIISCAGHVEVCISVIAMSDEFNPSVSPQIAEDSQLIAKVSTEVIKSALTVALKEMGSIQDSVNETLCLTIFCSGDGGKKLPTCIRIGDVSQYMLHIARLEIVACSRPPYQMESWHAALQLVRASDGQTRQDLSR